MSNLIQPHNQQIGLLAGAGRFPISFAKAAQQQGISVFCLGIQGMAPEELRDICDDFVYSPISKIGFAIRQFNKAGVNRAVMAGKIEKTIIFKRFRWLRYIPDMRTVHMACSYLKKDKKDDTILLAVIREFERDQIYFDSALDYCPELLVQHGFLTKKRPTTAQWKDIKFGWEMAKEMGRLDVGQTVIVHDTVVVAIEAIEGTDKAIRRAGELCERGNFTVVKVAKPQQDMRFDVPTIGVQTLQTMYESGGRVLAVESNKTILLDQEEVLAMADKLGICIVSLNSDELSMRVAS